MGLARWSSCWIPCYSRCPSHFLCPSPVHVAETKSLDYCRERRRQIRRSLRRFYLAVFYYARDPAETAPLRVPIGRKGSRRAIKGADVERFRSRESRKTD